MAHDQGEDFPVRRALWAAAWLALTVLAVIGASSLMLRYWHLSAGGPPAVPRVPLSISGHALQTDPQPDHARYLAAQQRWLDTAAWVDAPAGIARIPLDDAMALMAQGKAGPLGWPAAPATSTSKSRPASTSRGEEAQR